MGKLTSYILMVAGVVVIALPIIPGIKNYTEKLPFPAWVIMIAVLVILALGFVFMKPSTNHKQITEEVPIYHGNKIVGYRKATH